VDNSKKRADLELLCDKTTGKRIETSHDNFSSARQATGSADNSKKREAQTRRRRCEVSRGLLR
jgi:hypothetical protein